MSDATANHDLVQTLKECMPLSLESIVISGSGAGMVIVDEVNGFASVGCGNLAPPAENPQVTAMVEETDRLARGFQGQGWPVLAFLDTHEPGKPEPALLIPQQAVQIDQAGAFVLLVNSENKVEVRKVEVGPTQGLFIAVEKGLKAGEMVITEGIQKVRPGQVVNPAEAKPEA